MGTHVALLRGINVGGRNRVAMADLRALVTSLGHTGVATYIQSGNVIFTSAAPNPDEATTELAETLEAAIARELAVRPVVVVLSRAHLVQVITDNPFPHETDPKCLHAVFRREEMSPAGLAVVAAAQQKAHDRGSRDEAAVLGRTLFLRTPDGLGRSELAAQLTGSKVVAGAGTARNWATVTALLTLLDS